MVAISGVAIVAVQFDPGDDIPQAPGPPEDLAVPQRQRHGPGEGGSLISVHGITLVLRPT